MAAIVIANAASAASYTVGFVRPVISINATSTLTAPYSGSVISVVSSNADITITLPAAARGLYFDFIKAPQGAGTNIVHITGAAAGLMNGSALGAATAVAFAGTTNANFAAGANPKVGDRLSVACHDGVNWAVQGYGQTAGGFTNA